MTAVQPSSREPVEVRVAQAFHARADSVDVPAWAVDERYRDLRSRLDRRRHVRRPIQVALIAGIVAAAVAAFLLLAGAQGLLTTAPPPPAGEPVAPADPAQPAQEVLGHAAAQPRTAYTVPDFPVPLSFVTADLPEWAGTWARSVDGVVATVGLESAFDTGHPTVSVLALEETYEPRRPWTQQRALVPAPSSTQEWLDWLSDQPGLRTGKPEPVLVGGVEGRRLTFTVDELGPQHDGCFPGRGCIALLPLDAGPGSGRQRGLGEGSGGDLYVVEVEDRAVLIVAEGTASERDRWEPVLDAVVASITWT